MVWVVFWWKRRKVETSRFGRPETGGLGLEAWGLMAGAWGGGVVDFAWVGWPPVDKTCSLCAPWRRWGRLKALGLGLEGRTKTIGGRNEAWGPIPPPCDLTIRDRVFDLTCQGKSSPLRMLKIETVESPLLLPSSPASSRLQRELHPARPADDHD